MIFYKLHIKVQISLLFLAAFFLLHFGLQADDYNPFQDSVFVDSLTTEAWDKVMSSNTTDEILRTNLTLDTFISYAQEYGNHEYIGQFYYHKGVFSRRLGNLGQAKLYFDTAIFHFGLTADSSLLAQVYNSMIRIYKAEGKYDKVLVLIDKVIAIRIHEVQDENNVFGITKLLCDKAATYNAQGKLELTLKTFFKAINFADRRKCLSCKMDVYMYLIMFYKNLEDCQNMIRFSTLLEENLQHLKTLQNSYVWKMLGQVYISCNQDTNKAISYYFKSSEKYLTNGEKRLYHNSIIDIANIYLDMGKLDSALNLVLQVKPEISGDIYQLNQIHFIQGEIFLRKGNYEKSKKEFFKILELEKDVFRLSKAYEKLSVIFEKQKNYKQAYKYQKLFHVQTDSVLKMDQLNKLNAITTKYEAKQKEDQIVLLEKEDRFKTAKIQEEKKQKVLIIIIFILVIASLLFAYQRFKSKQVLALQKTKMEHLNVSLNQEKVILDTQQKLLLAQLNPHFIFNSISSIESYYIKNGINEGNEYLTRFALLMRLVLENSRKQFISISDEVHMIEAYLFLEQKRFKNKFEFLINIDKDINLSWKIPCMFIQPFVENSIIHGLATIAKDGLVKISMSMKDHSLVEIIIQDNGIGFHSKKELTGKMYPSQSMNIIKDRLSILKEKVNKNAYLNISVGTDYKGTIVKLILPYEKIE